MAHPTKDWEELRRDIEKLGPATASTKHGYKSVNNMNSSIRLHNVRDAKRIPEREPQTVGQLLDYSREARRLLPSLPSDMADKEIPEAIEQQLLSVEMLPIDSLIVDPIFQRGEDIHRQRDMAENWNWLACGTIAVNLRKGEKSSFYSVIDGQQRLGAIKLLGYKEAPCRVYLDLNKEQEAELFELLNRSRKPGYNDLFKSRLSRGEEVAKAISMAVEQVGYHLDPERKRRSSRSKDVHWYIQSMAEMERMYHNYGGKTNGVLHIMDTLKLVRDVWAPEHLGNQAMIIAGVAAFLDKYKNAVNRPDLVNKLKRKGPARLITMAYQWSAVHGGSGTGTRGRAFCEAMLGTYNENRQEGNRVKSKFI